MMQTYHCTRVATTLRGDVRTYEAFGHNAIACDDCDCCVASHELSLGVFTDSEILFNGESWGVVLGEDLILLPNGPWSVSPENNMGVA